MFLKRSYNNLKKLKTQQRDNKIVKMSKNPTHANNKSSARV